MDRLLCGSADRGTGPLPEGPARLLAQSHGSDSNLSLPDATRHWLGGLAAQLPSAFTLHTDAPAQEAARQLGAAGFVHRNRIVLGAGSAAGREAVLRHELVHLAQIGLALRGGRIAPTPWSNRRPRRCAGCRSPSRRAMPRHRTGCIRSGRS